MTTSKELPLGQYILRSFITVLIGASIYGSYSLGNHIAIKDAQKDMAIYQLQIKYSKDSLARKTQDNQPIIIKKQAQEIDSLLTIIQKEDLKIEIFNLRFTNFLESQGGNLRHDWETDNITPKLVP